MKLKLKMRDTDQYLSEAGLKDILALHDQVADYIEMINQAVKLDDKEVFTMAQVHSSSITRSMKEFRTAHLERVGTGTTTPLKSLIFTDMLNSYRRIKDHAYNIAEVLAGEK
jgi:phosphate:Na+ symporter